MIAIIFLVIIIIVVVAILGVCFYVGVFKIFLKSRRKVVDVLSNLRYIPEVVVVEEVIVEVKKPLSKRQLRKLKIRLGNSVKLRLEENQTNEQELAPIQVPDSVSAKLLNWVVNAFSSKTPAVSSTEAIVGNGDLELGLSDEEDGNNEAAAQSGEPGNSDGEEIISPSTKSKRFISQDRLLRKDARLLLVKPKEVVQEEVEESDEEEDLDNVVSLLSLEIAKKKRINEILDNRKNKKKKMEAAAESFAVSSKSMSTASGKTKGTGAKLIVDVVALNAGPSVAIVPPGYAIINQDIGPALITPEVLLYKRILYLWEEKNTKGWFIGTIVGTSESPGFNYRIKYDREETKTIFVDGIKAVFLSLSGEQAFGRRWVALVKTDPASKFAKIV